MLRAAEYQLKEKGGAKREILEKPGWEDLGEQAILIVPPSQDSSWATSLYI